MPMKYGANGLPEKSGMYWKRGVIYVAIRVNEKKFVFCTGTDKPKEALAFKSAKIAELIANEGIQTKRGVVIEDLLDDYIAHLERREQDRGLYMSDPYSKAATKCGAR